MNERIQELAYQAEDQAGQLVDQAGEFHPAFCRIFAELIVRECVNVVTDAVDHCEPASTYVGKIKEHFGQGKSQGKSQDDWRPDPDLA